ncbi:MAG: ABC transporter permease [Candidatus Pacebacteria bacterium]|nr:ABC transporter permease [Candidatus Paceibacterota bacterium]
MLVEIQRIFKSGWKIFTRQGNLSFATCLILIITIYLMAGLFLSGRVLNFAITEIRTKADVSVYFQQNSTQEDISALKLKLSDFEGVQNIEYVSKEQALESFIEKHKNEKDLMDSLVEVGSNPFLASLNVVAANSEGYEKVASFLNGDEFIDLIEKVDYHQRKSIIDKVFSVTEFLKGSGIIVAFALILISVLITFNTVKLAIYNQEKEIGIMRLVGASNWFIRGPFLVQGVLCGIASFVIAFALMAISSSLLSSRISGLFPGFQLLTFYKSDFYSMFFLQMFSGLILGIVPSFIAIRKYLEV